MFPKVLIFIVIFFIFSCSHINESTFGCKPFNAKVSLLTLKQEPLYICEPPSNFEETKCITELGDEGQFYYLTENKYATNIEIMKSFYRKDECSQICLTKMDFMEESFGDIIHDEEFHKLCFK